MRKSKGIKTINTPMKIHYLRILPFGILGILLSACGGPPAANQMLIDARITVEEVQRNEQVAANAPVALERAREYLVQSEELWQDKGDVFEIEHYAYMAKTRALIAQELAKINEAEKQVEQAEEERQRVLLDARTAEAERAEREAAAERAAADLARKQAEETLARAQELSQRISELEAQQTERGLVLTLNAVLFDFGKASLKREASTTLDDLTSFLNEYKNRRVLIEGYTDSSGSRQYNQDLSYRRASTVRDALIARGIASNRVQVKGYGEDYPVASNATSAGMQQNRRVEIVISDENGYVQGRN